MIKKTYKQNKEANVGDTCVCPSCGTTFIKTSYQQAFCKTRTGTKCKDKYWNTVIPTKRCNTTRRGPASTAYMIAMNSTYGRFQNYDDDQGWDAHKDSF
jgi:hypothetical protein